MQLKKYPHHVNTASQAKYMKVKKQKRIHLNGIFIKIEWKTFGMFRLVWL